LSKGNDGIANQQHVDFGAITGFVFFTEGEFIWGVAGQVAHGLLSIVCFALVGIAFLRFGWKVGVVDLGLLLIASNTALTFSRYLRKRSSGLWH
jgi:hypothetical protein